MFSFFVFTSRLVIRVLRRLLYRSQIKLLEEGIKNGW